MPATTAAIGLRRALCGMALLLAGCVSHRFYGPPLVRHDALTAEGGYSLLAVEFVDQGAYFRQSQREESIDELERRLACGALVVAFAHGWHNNAAPNNKYLDTFRTEFLQPLSGGRRVIGVYIGWRGETSWLPGLNQLTFFGTKDAAETVGSGAVTELLVRIDLTLRRINQDCAALNKAPAQFVVLGHSLGGLVIYSALSQLLVERFLTQTQPETFGDLVVLVNPAFEASRFRTLRDLANDRTTYPSRQRPLLLIAQSENDFATTTAFETSRFFAKMFEDVPDDPDHPDPIGLSRTAVGHYSPYRTHCIAPVATSGMPNLGATAACSSVCQHERVYGGAKLCKTGTGHHLNPILVAQVSYSIMNGHDNIWNPNFIGFLRDFVTQSLVAPEKSVQTSESAP